MANPDQEPDREDDLIDVPVLMDQGIGQDAPNLAAEHLIDIEFECFSKAALALPSRDHLGNEHEKIDETEEQRPLRPGKWVRPPAVLAVIVAIVDPHSRPLRRTSASLSYL